MKTFQISILVLVLLLPVGISSFMSMSDDEKNIELLENLTEEEEGDDKETKDLKESSEYEDDLQTLLAKQLAQSTSFGKSEFYYNNQNLTHVLLEVQTPPPRIS